MPTSRSGPRRRIAMIAVIALLLVALAGCGSSSSSSSSSAGGAAATPTTGQIKLAKTKFVLHAGLAFGAFHHWIYKPVRAGVLKHPFSHKVALVKAGLAAAFVYHELKLALTDAQSNPTLSKLVAPITALQDRFKGLSSDVKSGNTGAIDQANGSIASIKQQAASAGHPISEQVPSQP